MAEHAGRHRELIAGSAARDGEKRCLRVGVIDHHRTAVGAKKREAGIEDAREQALEIMLDADRATELDDRAKPDQLLGIDGRSDLVLEAQPLRPDHQLVAIAERRVGHLLRSDVRAAAAAEVADLERAVGRLDDLGVARRHHRVVDLHLAGVVAPDHGVRANGVAALGIGFDQSRHRGYVSTNSERSLGSGRVRDRTPKTQMPTAR